MKVVILAAGKGNRFGKKDLPKPLTQLTNGKSILQFQLDQIAKVLPLSRVIVVVGYHQEVIRRLFPQLTYVDNPQYAEQNTSKSLLKALQGIDNDCLWLNGDVVFNDNVLPLLLKCDKTAMVVNQAPVGEEEVKYKADKEGNILVVSKEIEEAQGEAVGINLFRKGDVPRLRQQLALCRDDDYFEKAVEGCIEEGMKVSSVHVDLSDCIEIDFPEDLAKANALLASWHL